MPIALLYCTSKNLILAWSQNKLFFFTVCLSCSLNAETAPWLISQKPVQKPAEALSSFL